MNGYLKTQVDKKYENSLPLIIFMGGLILTIFTLIVSSRGSDPIFGKGCFCLTAFTSILILFKTILKSFRCSKAEKFTKQNIVGFLNIFDIVSIIFAFILVSFYLLMDTMILNNIFCFSVMAVLIQILEFSRFYHLLSCSAVFSLV